jgi:tRNA (guanine37-N1)-methyltransferase
MRLTKEEQKLVPKSYEVVGDILIFANFPKELKKKEKEIAKEFLDKLKQVKVITKKTGNFSGKYRLQKLKIMAGERRKKTIHKENGVKIKVNPEKAYFSSKSSTERLRISKLIKKEERVLVMFSGVAPYPLTIAKHSNAKEVYGIESNPDAHELGLQNVSLNKFNNVILYKGDVKKILPKIKKKFDRIIMPHPSDSESYFKLTLSKLKPKGKIHMYVFEKEENFKDLKNKYKKYKPKLVKAGSPAPGKFRVCLDLKT